MGRLGAYCWGSFLLYRYRDLNILFMLLLNAGCVLEDSMGNSDVPGLETFLAGSIMVLASMRRRRETSTRHLPVLVASHNQKCSGFGSAAKNRRSVRHPMQRELSSGLSPPDQNEREWPHASMRTASATLI